MNRLFCLLLPHFPNPRRCRPRGTGTFCPPPDLLLTREGELAAGVMASPQRPDAREVRSPFPPREGVGGIRKPLAGAMLYFCQWNGYSPTRYGGAGCARAAGPPGRVPPFNER